MKRIPSMKFIGVLLAVAVLVFTLKSCKKVDNNSVNTTTTEKVDPNIIKAIKDRYGNVSAGFVYNINKNAETLFYTDASGNHMTMNAGKGADPSGICNYNCSNTSNPANLRQVYTLKYVQRLYKCEASTQSDVIANWLISVPYTPLATYGGNNSSGSIRITDPSSNVHTLSTIGFSITTIGADPNCSANTLYQVTFKATNVPDSYFGSGMLLEASLDLYNDCALVSHLVQTGYIGSPDFTLNQHLPCSRVDQVYVNPNTGPSNCATAVGNYAICSYPSGFALIDKHQVEYRAVNSGGLQWGDQTSTVYWGIDVSTSTASPTITPYGATLNLVNMLPSSGNWLVRYRNVKTSVCDIIYGAGSTPNGDWGYGYSWVTELWSL